MASSHAEITSTSTYWTIGQFLAMYDERKLRKPRIQRRKRWDHNHAVRFIEFINLIRNSIVSFMVNEKIVDGQKINYIFDGNNRSNAILDFCLQPLKFFPSLIPASFTATMKDQLATLTLRQLLAPRWFTLTKFLRTNCTVDIQPSEADETAWDSMIDSLAKFDFMNIKLQICIFDNLTDAQMQTIYEKTNATGVRLTEQELLASSTDSIRFTPSDIRNFHELSTIINRDYYESMNMNERLHVTTEDSASLNLFEILTALQCKLHGEDQFKPFIAPPSSEADGSLDIIFKMYQYLVGEFNIAPPPAQLDAFITTMLEGCQLISTTLNRIYDTSLHLKQIGNYHKLPKNTIALFLTYIATAKQRGQTHDAIVDSLTRIILWHDILQTLSEEHREQLGTTIGDDLQYKNGGGIVPEKLRHMKERGEFEYLPSNEMIGNLLKLALNECIESAPMINARKSRKPLTRFKAIAFTAFYNYQIPSAMKLQPQNADHIVPFKTKLPATTSINLCRLGNLQLITETINKRRGTRPITDDWIEENNLRYQHYPTGEEYARMCERNTMISASAFVRMCERREQLYIQLIMRMFT